MVTDMGNAGETKAALCCVTTLHFTGFHGLMASAAHPLWQVKKKQGDIVKCVLAHE